MGFEEDAARQAALEASMREGEARRDRERAAMEAKFRAAAKSSKGVDWEGGKVGGVGRPNRGDKGWDSSR